jgi:hypothetical protein
LEASQLLLVEVVTRRVALGEGLTQVLVVQAVRVLLDKVIMAALKIIQAAAAAVAKVLLAVMRLTQEVAQVAQGLFRLFLVCQSNMLVAVVVGTKQVALLMLEVWVLEVEETVAVMLQLLPRLCMYWRVRLLVFLILAAAVAVLVGAVLAHQILVFPAVLVAQA